MSEFPDGIQVPHDDGAADHLPGVPLPDLVLPASSGVEIKLSMLGHPRTVLYVYPGTGVPGQPAPDGWDAIPGARGCTAEACNFRDRFDQLAASGADVLGLSGQSMQFQQEAAQRLQLPFPLLVDPLLALADTLGLPTFELDGVRRYKRLTMIVRGGVVEQVFYPVFPPDTHGVQVAHWLAAHPLAVAR